jgi:hypothetical protein
LFPIAYACVPSGISIQDIFATSGLDSRNYAATLIGWANISTIYENLQLGTVSTTYCDTAQSARDTLITKGWTIIDGGVADASDCVVEEAGGGSSSATRVGDRLKAAFTGDTSSTTPGNILSVTRESFLASLQKFMDYLNLNNEEIEALPASEKNKLIVAMREIMVYLLFILKI